MDTWSVVHSGIDKVKKSQCLLETVCAVDPGLSKLSKTKGIDKLISSAGKRVDEQGRLMLIQNRCSEINVHHLL